MAEEIDFDYTTWAELASFMENLGLGELLSVDANGRPRGWLAEQVIAGVDTQAALEIALQETDAFKNRFPTIALQQEQVRQGQGTYVMTVADILDFERTVSQQMAASGMPSWFYNEPQDFVDLIMSGESPQSIANKIQTAYDYVESAPQEVREVFAEYYGTDSDAAFASYVLDPERTIAQIERAQRTAFTAGMGRRYDLEISRDIAEDISGSAMTEAGIEQGLQRIAGQEELFVESVGEAGDLTAEETGVAIEFGADSEAQTAVERRLAARQGVQRASVGGALLTERGVTGLS